MWRCLNLTAAVLFYLQKLVNGGGKEGTYQDIVSAPDVWNQIMVELGLSLNVLSFKPA